MAVGDLSSRHCTLFPNGTWVAAAMRDSLTECRWGRSRAQSVAVGVVMTVLSGFRGILVGIGCFAAVRALGLGD
jgi:hypothetical protein